MKEVFLEYVKIIIEKQLRELYSSKYLIRLVTQKESTKQEEGFISLLFLVKSDETKSGKWPLLISSLRLCWGCLWTLKFQNYWVLGQKVLCFGGRFSLLHISLYNPETCFLAMPGSSNLYFKSQNSFELLSK